MAGYIILLSHIAHPRGRLVSHDVTWQHIPKSYFWTIKPMEREWKIAIDIYVSKITLTTICRTGSEGSWGGWGGCEREWGAGGRSQVSISGFPHSQGHKLFFPKSDQGHWGVFFFSQSKQCFIWCLGGGHRNEGVPLSPIIIHLFIHHFLSIHLHYLVNHDIICLSETSNLLIDINKMHLLWMLSKELHMASKPSCKPCELAKWNMSYTMFVLFPWLYVLNKAVMTYHLWP